MTQVISDSAVNRRTRRRRSAPLIVFSGVDGAGKSTQVDLLFRALSEQGRRPVQVWARGGYTSGMLLLKQFLRSLAGNRLVPPSGQRTARHQAFARQRTRRWWLRLAILDLIRLYAVWARCQLFLGRPVICDRYLDDTLLDFQVNFPQEDVASWRLWRLATSVCPRPRLQLLMLIPLAEAEARSRKKSEPFPDTPEVRELRLTEYQQWQSSGQWQVLDGSQSVEQLARQVRQLVADGGTHSRKTVACA